MKSQARWAGLTLRGWLSITALLVATWLAAAYWRGGYVQPRPRWFWVAFESGGVSAAWFNPPITSPASAQPGLWFERPTGPFQVRWWPIIDTDISMVYIPLWILPVLSTAGALTTLIRQRRVAHARAVCPHCGYPRAGLPDAAPCPECGDQGASK